MKTAQIKEIASDIVEMLLTTVTEGDYATRPLEALRVWQIESNRKLDEKIFNRVIALIEW